jgi:hypothetical protein
MASFENLDPFVFAVSRPNHLSKSKKRVKNDHIYLLSFLNDEKIIWRDKNDSVMKYQIQFFFKNILIDFEV